ncbi:predicted protein [Streptomyces sp. AA4]|nr:predicted protein [Streptomyces sp. AA4]
MGDLGVLARGVERQRGVAFGQAHQCFPRSRDVELLPGAEPGSRGEGPSIDLGIDLAQLLQRGHGLRAVAGTTGDHDRRQVPGLLLVVALAQDVAQQTVAIRHRHFRQRRRQRHPLAVVGERPRRLCRVGGAGHQTRLGVGLDRRAGLVGVVGVLDPPQPGKPRRARDAVQTGLLDQVAQLLPRSEFRFLPIGRVPGAVPAGHGGQHALVGRDAHGDRDVVPVPVLVSHPADLARQFLLQDPAVGQKQLADVRHAGDECEPGFVVLRVEARFGVLVEPAVAAVLFGRVLGRGNRAAGDGESAVDAHPVGYRVQAGHEVVGPDARQHSPERVVAAAAVGEGVGEGGDRRRGGDAQTGLHRLPGTPVGVEPDVVGHAAHDIDDDARHGLVHHRGGTVAERAQEQIELVPSQPRGGGQGLVVDSFEQGAGVRTGGLQLLRSGLGGCGVARSGVWLRRPPVGSGAAGDGEIAVDAHQLDHVVQVGRGFVDPGAGQHPAERIVGAAAGGESVGERGQPRRVLGAASASDRQLGAEIGIESRAAGDVVHSELDLFGDRRRHEPGVVEVQSGHEQFERALACLRLVQFLLGGRQELSVDAFDQRPRLCPGRFRAVAGRVGGSPGAVRRGQWRRGFFVICRGGCGVVPVSVRPGLLRVVPGLLGGCRVRPGCPVGERGCRATGQRVEFVLRPRGFLPRRGDALDVGRRGVVGVLAGLFGAGRLRFRGALGSVAASPGTVHRGQNRRRFFVSDCGGCGNLLARFRPVLLRVGFGRVGDGVVRSRRPVGERGCCPAGQRFEIGRGIRKLFTGGNERPVVGGGVVQLVVAPHSIGAVVGLAVVVVEPDAP